MDFICSTRRSSLRSSMSKTKSLWKVHLATCRLKLFLSPNQVRMMKLTVFNHYLIIFFFTVGVSTKRC